LYAQSEALAVTLIVMNTDGLRQSFTLLTAVPLPGHRVGDEQGHEPDGQWAATITWAPAVGLALGVAAALVLVTADRLLKAGPLVGAALAVATLAALTKGLHLDGLADLADGLGSSRPPPEALAIMRKSDIGPFGVITLVLTLLIQVAALTQAEAEGDGRGPAALIAATITGRLALAWACRQGVPAAQPDGLGAQVAGTVSNKIPVTVTVGVLAAAIAAVVISVIIHEPLGWTLPVAVAAGLAAALALLRHAVRRLGGITGDVLGALVEVATATCLLVAAMGPAALRPGEQRAWGAVG
jgi:adenosylcobinamide-GDP ribazoletransferase